MLDGALSNLGREPELDNPEADAEADGVFPNLLFPPVNALRTLFRLVRFASS